MRSLSRAVLAGVLLGAAVFFVPFLFGFVFFILFFFIISRLLFGGGWRHRRFAHRAHFGSWQHQRSISIDGRDAYFESYGGPANNIHIQ